VPFPPSKEGRFVFISHSHADRGAGFEFFTPLANEGYQLWYDEGLTPTRDWAGELDETIGDCALFVLLLSRVSVNRDEVLKEARLADGSARPILVIHLEPTPLPESVGFLRSVQGIEARGRSYDDVLSKLRAQLDAHEITRTEPPEEVDPWGWDASPQRDESERPTMDAGDTSLTSAFADRIPQSEALAASVAHQRRALSGEIQIDRTGRTNVLVFYGGGGVGKSGLSQQLERWVSGDAVELAHWGQWEGGPVIPVRWDFNDSEGNIPFAHLVRELRHALTREVVGADGVLRPLVERPLLRFDLALAAYLEAVSGRDRQSLELTGKAAGALLASLRQLAGIQKAGIPEELTANVVQQVVDRTLRSGPERLFEGFSLLREFLHECDRIPQGSEAPELVAKLVFILTEEIFRLPADERPALVFFVDHFERVQRKVGRSYESNLTRIVASMPYSLFVITGRNKLDWADPRRTDLHFHGPARWPWLADQDDFDPRQHSLGRLSPEDTERLYQGYRTRYGWNLSDDLIERLVRRSDGLPLHIEAVLKLTLSLNEEMPGRRLTAAELDKDLPEVVLRLMNVLNPKERDAFRAACVLPFFDSQLVEVVGGVQEGDVAHAVTYALVEANRGSTYPYRVHDEIRRLVQQDRGSEGYWGGTAWLEAARRGLEEAKRRIVVSHEAETETEETRAVALAVRIAAEWGLETTEAQRQAKTDLETAVTRAPSMALVAQLLPLPTPGTPKTGIETLIRLVHASAMPYKQGIEALLALRDAPGRAAVIARRFAAYRLRALHQYDEALVLLAGVIESYPTEVSYTRKQYAATLRSGRRFRDWLDYLEEHGLYGPSHAEFRVNGDHRHGVFPAETEIETATRRDTIREATKSARVALEQEIGWLALDAVQGRASEDRILALLAESTRRRYRAGIRTCLRVLGYFYLADEPTLGEIIRRVDKGIEDDETNALTVAHLLSLRALLTGDPADARAAHESVRPGPRGMASIPVEVWLAELGYPLEPVETQWLIPYEQVRANWMRIAEGIIQRARECAERRESSPYVSGEAWLP
jgi:hypothetical protein